MNNENRENMSSSQANMNTTQRGIENLGNRIPGNNDIRNPKTIGPRNNTSNPPRGTLNSPPQNTRGVTPQGNLSPNKKGATSLNNASSKASQALSKMGPKGKLASKALDGMKKASNLRKNGNGNTPSLLKNKGFGQNVRNRFLGGSSNEEGTSSAETQDNYQEESENTDVSDITTGSTNTLAKFMKLLPLLLPLIFIVVLVLLVVVLLATPLAVAESFFGLEYHNTDQAAYLYNSETEPELSAAEKEYYDKIEETVADYKEKYGVTINKQFLNGTLSYRYLNEQMANLYSSNSGVSDSDLENANNGLVSDSTKTEEGDEESTTGESKIDYTEATKKIGVVAALMIQNNGDGTYSTDTEENGIFYTNLVNSDFLKTYYKDFLKDEEEETKKKLVDDIFFFSKLGIELVTGTKNTSFLSDSLAIYLQTCDYQGKYATKYNERGKKIFDNPLVNSGTEYSDYLVLSDYLKGVVMAELGTQYMTEEYREGIKAFTVAATTFLLGSFYVDFYPGVESIPFPTGDCRQVSCDPNYGCSYQHVTKYSTTYSGVDRQYDVHGIKIQRPGWKKPLTDAQQEYMDSILEEVFGEIMVNKGVTADTFTGSSDVQAASYYDSKNNSNCGDRCLGQVEALRDAKNGMSYTEILAKYYHSDSYDLINIKEGLYFQTTQNYSGQMSLNESFHFHQGDYSNSRFCEGGSISGRGCSVTSTAIAVSLLTGQKHDPAEISNRLKSEGDCNGNRVTYPASAASYYGLRSYTVSKGQDSKIDQMLQDLATGNTVVVARLASNSERYNTKSGHYIALVGVKTEGSTTRVLVWDPGSRSASRDNYWADFDEDILKYVNRPSFVVISRR